jgi:cellulose synthase/poly-beta-1,6-N-acetylglucosamine synthase-like glycosyltransferase
MTLRLLEEALLLAASVAVAVPIAVFFLECVAALSPRRRRPVAEAPPTRPLAVLVPAHDEETGVGPTLRGIREQLEPGDRVVVVADNCSDATAEKARAEGVEVLERKDDRLRGKGYALSFGLHHLKAAPPDLVVFIDADTKLDPGAIRSLRDAAAGTRRPVQAVYRLDPQPGAGVRDFISSFAFLTKNLVRPAGLARLGVPCHILGTGMALPWELIDIDRLATGNIVEDMQMGIDLAIAGTPPLFCLDASVSGSLPASRKAALTQRTRWEHGHLATLLTQAPRLAWQALRRGRASLLGLALDLSVPPLALLCLLWAVVAAACGIAAWRGWSLAPAIVTGSAGIALLVAVFLAWAGHARRVIPGRVLFFAPLYILWKIPLYAAFLFKRQTAWVRTARDEPTAPPPPPGSA